jgi:hypothetical protein
MAKTEEAILNCIEEAIQERLPYPTKFGSEELWWAARVIPVRFAEYSSKSTVQRLEILQAAI